MGKRKSKSPPDDFLRHIPKILPVIKVEPAGMILFPSALHTGFEFTNESVRAGYPERMKQTPYLIAVPQIPRDPEAKIGLLSKVVSAGQQKGVYNFNLLGVMRVRTEIVSRSNNLILAKWSSLIDTAVPRETAENPSFRNALAELRNLFTEFLENVTNEDFFNQQFVKDAVKRVEMLDAENLSSAIDGIMNILNHTKFEDNGHLDISLPSLIVFRETDPPTRLGAVIQLLYVLLHGEPVDSGVPNKNPLEELLGKESGLNPILERWRKIQIHLPEEVKKEIELELRRLGRPSQETREAEKRLEWLLFLPWIEETADPNDIANVRDLLDQSHAGLEKAKERIEEFIAVRMLNPSAKGPILCFVGPPGTGKTSLAHAIARALGRKCMSLALGGFDDPQELVGFHQTYYKSAPGALMMLLKRCNTKNPVVVLDEIDKLGKWRGDPAAALLEILDPEQNAHFRDHYLNVPFDLSRVLFITTANILDTIPPTLRDRLEIIEFPGYTPTEKLHIARQYLVKRQCQGNGFPFIPAQGEAAVDIQFSDEAILELILNYTQEAGVRNLEKQIAKAFRRLARRVKSGDTSLRGVITITRENLREFCGKPQHSEAVLPEIFPTGTVPVLAVSETGGQLFMLEVTINRHPGKRKIAMKGVRESRENKDTVNKIAESLEKAFDALTSTGKLLHDRLKQLEEEFGAPIILEGNITNGAIPKDGPSAGLSAFLAVYGALTGQSIKPTVETPLLAATGQIEVNLDGIGEIGGLRDKIFAASRRGVKICFVPEANAADLEDIPEELKSLIRIVPMVNRWEAVMAAYPNDIEKIQTYLNRTMGNS